MKKVRLNDLGKPFQEAVDAAGGEPIIIEDEQGEEKFGVYRLGEPSEEQKREAWEGLRKIQEKATAALKEAGKTEEDVMRELLEDD